MNREISLHTIALYDGTEYELENLLNSLLYEIDQLEQELQRKDNKINKIKSIIENIEGCKIVGTNDELISKKFVLDVLDKIKDIENEKK